MWHVVRLPDGQTEQIIPTVALTTWLQTDDFDGLFSSWDINHVRCAHGNLDLSKSDEVRLISADAFDRLSQYDASLPDLKPCVVCVAEEYKKIKGNRSHSENVSWNQFEKPDSR